MGSPWTIGAHGQGTGRCPQTNGCMFGVHFGWVPLGLSGPMDKEQGGAPKPMVVCLGFILDGFPLDYRGPWTRNSEGPQTNGCMFGVHFGWVPLGLSGPIDKEQGGAPKPMVVCLGFILDGFPLDYRGPWTRNSEGPQTNGCMFGVHFGWVPLGLSGPMDKEQGGALKPMVVCLGFILDGFPWSIGAPRQGNSEELLNQ